MLRVGIIGCGAIGTSLAEAIDTGIINKAKLVAVYDLEKNLVENLIKRLKNKPKKYNEFKTFLTESNADIVIEAASQKAVSLYAEKIISSGKDMMIMSAGALLNEEFLKKITKLAEEYGSYVHVPSGAIGGLDVIKAAKINGLKKVILTTRKNPESLKGSPYFQKIMKNKNALKKTNVIFEGVANDVVKLFPANVNVSAILSLAGLGGANTLVRVISDPTIKKNIHELDVEGRFGKMKIILENSRHSSNPKTSYLAVLSAIENLRSISEKVVIGT
ncbi:aspartate dehydrogenase [Thermoproteota archaeon]